MYATISVCAAIASRERTGEGQFIDMALLDTQVAILANQGMNFLATGEAPGRLGNTHPNIVPYQSFKTKDGDIILACGNDNLFKKFCDVADAKHLPADPRFASNGQRVANRAAMDEVLNPIFLQRTTAEWVSALEKGGVPCGPINNLKDVFEDEQVKARGMRIELPHASAGKVPVIRSPMRFSGTPIEHRMGPPTLGQHTEEVLRDVLGKPESEIGRLKDKGIV
jgi:crotonobetainyl-CoA:carnitine CoA-transferase CaiB-like acyl-CoA transferase